MPAGGVFRAMRELYFRSPLSDWRLDRPRPERLVAPPGDVWPGSPDAGRSILEGAIARDGAHVADAAAPWDRPVRDEARAAHLHGFAWLRDLRALGGEAARTAARELVGGWIDRHGRWRPLPWRPDILGRRLASWIGTWGFFCESAPEAFQARVLASLSRQAGHAARDLAAAPAGAGRLEAIGGLAIAGAALGFEEGLETAEAALSRELARQVFPDGAHASRSPARHCDALAALIDTRDAFRAGGRPVPAALDDAIARMTAMLRLWRHGDGGLALFNRSTEGEPAFLENLLARSGSRRRAPREAPDAGFHRLAARRVRAIVDTGAPAALDGAAHAGLLSFELSAGRQRLIVNCGASPGDPRWSGPLRATAAHSTLAIDDVNAAAVTSRGGLGGGPVSVSSAREERDGATILRAEHDGYRARFGVLHRRRLRLSETGDDLSGEDRLVYTGDPGAAPRMAVLRFHLHPRIAVSLVRGGASALLRGPAGGGWRLSADEWLELNESVYFGARARQRCDQVAIWKSLEGLREAGEIAISWSLRREDARGRPAAPAGGAARMREGEASRWPRSNGRG